MLKTFSAYLTIFSLMTSQLYAIETSRFTDVELSNPVSSSNPLAKMEAGEGTKVKSAQNVSPSDEDKGVRTALLPKQYAEGHDPFTAKIVICGLLGVLGYTLYLIFKDGFSCDPFSTTQMANPTQNPAENIPWPWAR